MASPQQVAFITQRAQAMGLDPQAVLAIAGHEGIGGGIGDGGHAFGPFQLNNAGGVLTGKFAGQTPQQINDWAWSPAGVNYALGGIAKVAGGLKGNAAIQAIATKFERPLNPGAEIADAEAHYGAGGTLTGSAAGQLPASDPVGAGGSISRQQLAQIVFGAGNGVNFNSNQIETPNLMALAQARAAASGTTAPAVSAQGAPVTPGATPGTAPAKDWKGGSPVADMTGEGPLHQTEGLAGYPAHDYFAPAGSAAVAPVTGKVVRLSGHDPSEGPIDGPHGPLGWSVYIQGTDGHSYYLTHMGSRSVQVGQVVRAGQPIGTVANYAKYGTPSHIHMGVD